MTQTDFQVRVCRTLDGPPMESRNRGESRMTTHGLIDGQDVVVDLKWQSVGRSWRGGRSQELTSGCVGCERALRHSGGEDK